MNWDRRFMDLARHVAQWSKDPSTKVGAVLVGHDRREIALGYNGFPPRVNDTSGRLADRDTKYRLTQHAERNALDNARFDPSGGTLFVTFFPCCECAKSIVSLGLARVVTMYPDTREPWREQAAWSTLILREGGVRIDVFRESDDQLFPDYELWGEVVDA